MPTFVQIKKAGLRVAVPLYEALVLPFIPNKQHRSPRRICTHTRVPNKYTRHKIYISWGHQLLQCLGIKIEFTRFRKAKNKALRTPFRHKGKVARFDAYILKCRKPYWGLGSNIGFPRGDTSHPLNPDVGLSATKIQLFFNICNKYVHFLLKTWILDRKWLPLPHKRNWNYIRVDTDFILGNFIRVDTELF